MNRMYISWLAVGLAAAGGCSHFAERRFAARLQGKPAPDFQLEDIEGNAVRLGDFRARPVVVNFFGYG
jgi:hypothetical protein